MEFLPFPKLSRLSRKIVISEKLDGTNAQIYIMSALDDSDEKSAGIATPIAEKDGLLMFAGSRTRWIKPGGTYLAVNYMVCDADGPPFPSTREELWRRFRPHFHLIDQWVPRSYHNRTGRELMCWWRRK